jgi:altronate dehydratase small subunit
MIRAIVMETYDNVATLLSRASASDEVVTVSSTGEKLGQVVLSQSIPIGHKVAIQDIAEDSDIIKYGQVIGYAKEAIKKGDYVHVHNVGSKYAAGRL